MCSLIQIEASQLTVFFIFFFKIIAIINADDDRWLSVFQTSLVKTKKRRQKVNSFVDTNELLQKGSSISHR
jgi:hypothetical protein